MFWPGNILLFHFSTVIILKETTTLFPKFYHRKIILQVRNLKGDISGTTEAVLLLCCGSRN